jgi:hypothetical protein
MNAFERNPEYVVPHGVIDAIASFLRGREFRTIHYIGYADDELIKSLIREGHYKLSLMDYWDRHHREKIGFLAEEGLDHSHLVVPDWLDDIPTYIEGAPQHEVLLQDIPWLEGQLERLDSRRGHPACIVLFGEAQRDASHSRYDWRDIASLRVGFRRDTTARDAPAQGRLFGN